MNTALTPAGLVLSIASHGFSFNTKTSKVKKMYYLRSGSPWGHNPCAEAVWIGSFEEIGAPFRLHPATQQPRQ